MTTWKRASGCDAGNCAEVWVRVNCPSDTADACAEVLYRADEDGVVLDAVWVRSSVDLDAIVKFTPDEWSAFTAAVRHGEF